jgi:hypothetical protein
MRREYKLAAGRPNPYAKRIGAAGRTVLLERFLRAEHFVRLDDDVAEAFEDETAVNEALRLVLRAKALATRTPRKTVRPARRRRRKSA